MKNQNCATMTDDEFIELILSHRELWEPFREYMKNVKSPKEHPGGVVTD